MNKEKHYIGGEKPRNSFARAIASLLVFSMIFATVGCNASVDTAVDSKIDWDYEADVVVIGAGGSGLSAALKALEDGASVLVVETNWDAGGHAAVSEGQLHSGGSTISQKQWNIEDSADLYYYDNTRGTTVASRFNNRDYVRSVSNSMVEAYDFILKNGVKVQEIEPMVRAYYRDGGSDSDSVGRMTYVDASEWENELTGTNNSGIGVTRPLEKELRDKGARFLMNYHMDTIYREGGSTGKVVGVDASYTPHIMPGETEPLTSFFSEGNIESTEENVKVKANKSVIIATGGSTGNVNFRTMIDPRLGPEYDGLAGMPFSNQDASGELAAMEIGASLGSLGSYSLGSFELCAPRRFGTRYGYGTGFNEKSKVWDLVVAPGFQPSYDSLCIVNMVGSRVGNEDQYAASQMVNTRFEFLNNAMSSVFIDPDGDGNAESYGGPLWAIFDQAAADRNDWVMEQGSVDFENGYCFKADTLEELAEMIVNKYHEDIKMDPKTLVDTITRYNGFVVAGKDDDWGKTSLGYSIEQGPFYAAWATPSVHDTMAGLRVNENMQVIDIHGECIPSLFCAGEASGGMAVHGLGRVITSGYIAGRAAASVDKNGFATADTSLDTDYPGDETNYKTKTDKAEYYSMRSNNIDTMTHSDKEAELAAIAAAGTEVDENKDETQTPTETPAAKDNVFIGTSDKGMGGTIQVQITVDDGKITDIEILKQNETTGIGPEALEKLVPQALEIQSAEVDVVSGATVTSEAFKEALTLAIGKAGL